MTTTNDAFGPGLGTAGAVSTRPGDSRAFTSTDSFSQDCSGSPPSGGTAWTAEQLNEIIANLRGLLRVNGALISGSAVVAEDHADTMLSRAVQQAIQRGQATYVADIGTSDALVCNPSPAVLEYKAGVKFTVLKGAAANATTTPTVNFSSLGALTLVDNNGGALFPGALHGGATFDVELDGAGNARVMDTDALFYAADTGSANAVAVSIPRYGAAYAAGRVFHVKLANALTGAATINLNTIGSKALTRADGTNPGVGDGAAGQVIACVYDGTQVQIVGTVTWPHSLTSNGYVKLPDGLIMQWGSAAAPAGTPPNGIAVVFPITFPNAAYALAYAGNSGSPVANGYSGLIASGVTLWTNGAGGEAMTFIVLGR